MRLERAHRRPQMNRSTDGTFAKVQDSFSTAWKEGKTWAITLEDDGVVKVRIGNKAVHYYQDAADFAAQFFPDIVR